MQTLRQKNPTYEDLNGLIANVMSGITTPLRFPGLLNSWVPHFPDEILADAFLR